MRINVPNTASTQLFNTGNEVLEVEINNVGPVPVWISDQQILLDGSVDPVAGTINAGAVINPGEYRQNVLIRGQRWARAQAPNAQLEVFTYPVVKEQCSCGH